MLLPESMSRIVIVGARSRMEEAIEALLMPLQLMLSF